MRIVLIGKNGQLGWEFQRVLPALGEVISMGRDQLDVSDSRVLEETISAQKPNLIINASAYTNVDLAEKESESAMRVNAVAPGTMAEVARKLNAVFIHYSTDYVFDGGNTQPYRETDATNPLNMYGKSKLMGEENIKQAGEAYLILRTSWVYSLRGNSFVNKVLEWARKNETLKIVDDQISNPTWARALAEITVSALAENKAGLLEKVREKRGIYHLTGSGFASRYEWAKLILDLNPNRTGELVRSIEPVSSDEFPTPAARPRFSALDCSKFQKNFDLSLPDWKKSLQAAMSQQDNLNGK